MPAAWSTYLVHTREIVKVKEVVAMPDQLHEVIESNQPEQLGTGFVFTEGPLWHPEGYWLFVDPVSYTHLRAHET